MITPIRNKHWLVLASASLLLCALALMVGSVSAQDSPFELGGLTSGGFDDGTPPYVFSGDFTLDQGTRNGKLNVKLKIKDGWHGYSQKKLDGQTPTVLNAAESADYKVVGPFVPDSDPKPTTVEFLGPAEEFEKQVTWTAPIELAGGVDEKKLEIKVVVKGQVCGATNCIPFNKDKATILAKLSKYTQSMEKIGTKEFRAKFGHAAITGQLSSNFVKAGQSVKLTITATMDPSWHIYKFEKSKPEEATSWSTLIYFPNSSGWNISAPKASAEPIEHKALDEVQFYHEGQVTWSFELTAPEDAKPGKYTLGGKMVYQVCSELCDRPTVVDFQVPLEVGPAATGKPTAITFAQSETSQDDANAMSKSYWAKSKSASSSLPAIPLMKLLSYLVMGLLAGLILNAMPCVLPVIGLKVMSFMHQAGEQRSRIFLLNLVFSLGLMTIFWILATLSAFFGFGWGDWLTKSMTGSIIITSVVFAFGLSMLGVWEVPIPGLSGSGAVGKKADEEGLSGAFALGILTTILATPCTGPLLIPALAITAGQPAWVTYAIFTAIGLGMALPYLVIGIFPSLIIWLPRPAPG